VSKHRGKASSFARHLARSDADFGLLTRMPRWGGRKQFLAAGRERFIPIVHTDGNVHNKDHKPQAEVERSRHNAGTWLFAQRIAADEQK